MRNDIQNPIIEKTFKFSLSIIKYCEFLEKEKKYAIFNQLIRGGTSIG